MVDEAEVVSVNLGNWSRKKGTHRVLLSRVYNYENPEILVALVVISDQWDILLVVPVPGEEMSPEEAVNYMVPLIEEELANLVAGSNHYFFPIVTLILADIDYEMAEYL